MAFTATKDMLLPATVTGSWPRPRWYTQNMWGRPLDTAMMDPWYREQFPDAHAIVVSDQERAGLDVLTTGDYHLDEDVAGRSWHHYPLQRWSGLEHEELPTEKTRARLLAFPRDSHRSHYDLDDKKQLTWDMAEAMNLELRQLADSGCEVIQIE